VTGDTRQADLDATPSPSFSQIAVAKWDRRRIRIAGRRSGPGQADRENLVEGVAVEIRLARIAGHTDDLPRALAGLRPLALLKSSSVPTACRPPR